MDSVPNIIPLSDEILFIDIIEEKIRPLLMVNYVWDACIKGKVFNPKTYETGELTYWINVTLEHLLKGIPLPKHFDKRRVIRHLREKTKEKLLNYDFEKSFKEIEMKDVNSLLKFIRENKKKEEEKFERLIDFFRNEEFHPVLWMELKRFKEILDESIVFLTERMKAILKYSPKRKGSVRSKNEQVKRLIQPFQDLIESFFNATLNFIRILFFVEIWSSKDMGDLFKRKKLTLKEVDPSKFEEVFFMFHDSVNQLVLALSRFQKKSIKSDFDDPTGWALKQLILKAEL